MMLTVEGLEFAYPSHPVLRDISFSIARGDFLAVLGTNGAGKSTLLKCINRILQPQGGAVLIAGDDARTLSRRELACRIGYVPQHIERTRTTVFDAVLLGRKPYIRWEASAEDMEIARQALRTLGLENYALRYVDELSGGERQKVVIARALAQRPKLLLLDEPTHSLDLKNQFDVARLIKKIVAEEGLAAIAAIHDLNLAMRFANKFLLLKEGAIFAAGGFEVITQGNIESVYSLPVEIKQFGDIPVVIPA
ncbi:MAG: ABC transporter ATP-binding protein [Limnochordia bacterium]|nr:ABC transporter ATP-binding protein [Bacillota bacterium]